MRASRCLQAIVLAIALSAILAAAPRSAFAQPADEVSRLQMEAVQLYMAGKFADAARTTERAAAIAEQQYGSDSPLLANVLQGLAVAYLQQGLYAKAEPVYKRVLAIRERALGPEHTDVATTLYGLATLYVQQGRYAEAEPLYKRTLAIKQKTMGPEHNDVGTTLFGLAALYVFQGRFAEAEPLYKRALAIKEKALGPDHSEVGTTLHNLAVMYALQGRTDEAEALYKRTLAIKEKALGPDHPDVASVLYALAQLYVVRQSFADAEPLYKRALAIKEKALGPEHTEVGTTLYGLAVLYTFMGRYAEAEPLYQRTLAIKQKALGSEHSEVGSALFGLAGLYGRLGRFPEAEQTYQRALAIKLKALGPDHPETLQVYEDMGDLYFAMQQWDKAAAAWHESTAGIIRRSRRATEEAAAPSISGQTSEAERAGSRFWRLVKASFQQSLVAPATAPDIAFDMFTIAQWAHASQAATSLAQMAARQAKGGGPLAGLTRERQDLAAEWQARDKLLIAAVSQPPATRNPQAEQEQRARLAAIDARIAQIDKTLTKDFPDYAALASPEPVDIRTVQDLLRDDEALLLYLDTPAWGAVQEQTFIWAVTKTDAFWAQSTLGTTALASQVAALRCGLDNTSWYVAIDWPEATPAQKREKDAQIARRRRCVELLGTEPTQETLAPGEDPVEVLPFDAARASGLYQALLGPVEDHIKGKRLLIVPSGALTSLPFGVLVTKPVTRPIPEKLADYRNISWLGTQQAISVLPSVASLKALRQFAKASTARNPYLGIGNPLLEGDSNDTGLHAYYQEQAQAARAKRCSTPAPRHRVAALRGLRRSAPVAKAVSPSSTHADIEDVRHWTPLPETADELCTVGRRLGAPASDVLIGAQATESRIKDMSASGALAGYRIVHFATHGALTGQVQGSSEPGLILTPPRKGTSDAKALERDDGFLAASEIATLKLDADWVILSACNTAGGSGAADSGGAEALSGMARAFFYSGARALLVSHWEVGSDAAVKITTRAFAELAAKPGLSRAGALELSMRDLMENGEPEDAHPSEWAPLVVVGEGS
ncbi:MAG TPA: CHAT domain-containing tetratricopeptide repeat protein [Hyphomicrobiaceae bacterium]|nr:CHAT domain-containing tetratricopeptide repeat protein [Hyphomicrobiaceae bacterium]